MKSSRSLNAAKRAQAGKKKKLKQAAKQQFATNLGIYAPLRSAVKALPKTSLRELLAQAKPALQQALTTQPAPLRVFFSFSTGKGRAQVVNFTARDVKHLEQKLNSWQQRRFKTSPAVRWLRVDWVVSQNAITWQALPAELARHKRNYFRYGIALDADFKQAFLEQELNANAMLYPQNNTSQAGLNPSHFLRYGQARFGKEFQLPQDPEQPLLLFTTEAQLFQPDQAPVELYGYSGGSEGRNTGRRKIEALDAPQVENLIAQSSQFLAEQVDNKGKFVYGVHPCFDRDIDTYNTLRHASTTYSMIEAWEVTQSAELKSAIDRSLTFLTQELIRRYTLANGEKVAYLQDKNNEIKLGGNAVCLLALVKYTELTQDQSYLPLLEQLALGILHLQNSDTGQFTHVLNAHDLSVKETFRIIYYDGEAAFGLMRLYGLTRDERWLNTVVKAFDYFIAQKHWQIHDHWLSYCVNELTLYRPEERYFQFGIRNVAGHLDFVIKRITTFPTLLELMMAAHKMITRLQTSDDIGCQQNRHLLKGLDLDKFYRALETRAHYLLNGFFWPEFAMFFKNPQRILGSFFIRHHSFRVRIDDVEHYLSGFVAYLNHYLPKPYVPSGGQPDKSDTTSAPVSPPLLGAYSAAGVLAWGGDVNLGRRQHYRSQQLGFDKTLVIPELKAADLTVVNLECVVSTLGEQGVIKGEGGPYYYRARPEMLQVLTEASVNLVTVANNHSGDYGPEALMQQQQLLEAIGIASAGSGIHQQAAFAPSYQQAGDVTVAVFAIDATQHRFAATAERPGAAYLPPDQPALWQATLAPLIAQAKQQADLVVLAVHWGVNQAEQPDQNEIALGHAIIDAGADAILGASAHRLQGIEIYRNKPIIHDAGDLLFDSVRADLADSGIFQLGLTKQGVSWVRFVPVGVGFGFAHRLSGASAQQVIQRYAKKCEQLGTRLISSEDDAYLLLEAAEPLVTPRLPQEKPSYALEALHRFTLDEQQLTVEQVPEEAAIEPVELNGLTLLGVRVHPTHLTRRRMLWVETWWQANTPPSENLRLDYQARPQTQHKMPAWGRGMDHDPCDWLKPTITWQPGKIYRDFYGLRPPQMHSLINDTLQLHIRVLGSKTQSEPWIYPENIRLGIPGLNVSPLDRNYRTDFSGLDLSVLPGQTWTAKQLQDITGGQWLVAPPPGWFVRSVVNGKKHLPLRQAPVLFVAHTNQDRSFHENSTQPVKSLGDRHLQLPELAPDLAGAFVSRPVQGLPQDFPLLKVDDPIKAFMQLGLAARQRYQGPVIAITGTAGKSSTLRLIETLFDPGCYLKSVDNYNSRVGAPVQLASLAPDHQAALIEIAQSALWMQRGPITRKIKPTIAILTEIGLSQTNRMVKTTEDTVKWKSRIFDGLTEDGIAIIGEHLLHFDAVLKQAKKHAKQVLVFGTSDQADLQIIDQRPLEHCTGLQLKINGQLIELQLPFTSRGMIHNALATLTTAYALGIDLNTAADCMSTRYVPEEGRMEEYRVELAGKQVKIIDDSWNATTIAMLNAFSVLKSKAPLGRKIAVLGRIVHLGDQAAALHVSLAEPLIATGVDLVLTHGDEMRYLRERLPSDLLGPHFSDARALFAELKQQVQPEDCILLKGSRRDSDFGDISKLLKENICSDKRGHHDEFGQIISKEPVRTIMQDAQLIAEITKGCWYNIECLENGKKLNEIK
ncbi:CapA family protein [Oceanimonas baumannii]|uniref:CapA family protein n=1 Tax=Oceanimonas baumannii TaxID=129578 RepID=UPI001D1881BC|nr:CapA family protein [Oceanimonas baumannii]MCC4265656.1 CapA family protein [Oceanimonas baumannii]